MRVRQHQDHRNHQKTHGTYTINTYWVKRDLDTIMEEFDWASDHRRQSRFFSTQRHTISSAEIADRLAKFLTLKNEVEQQGFLSDHQLCVSQQLANIACELREVYHYPLHELDHLDAKAALDAYFHLAESANLNEHFEKVFSPRLQFLIKRYLYLKQLDAVLSEKTAMEALHDCTSSSDTSKVQQTFDISKKALDLIDDAWDALKNVVKGKIIEKIGPFLSSSVGFIIHLGEGLSAAKIAYKAYRDASTPQRKTKIAVGSLSFAMAGAGLGLSISWVLGLTGVAVTGASLFPIIIPALLTGIYAMNIWRDAYSYHQAKKQTRQAKADYQACVARNQLYINDINTRILQREQVVKAAYQAMAPIARKIVDGETITFAESALYQVSLQQIKHCAQSDRRDYRKLAHCTAEIEMSRKKYVATKEARAEAGREVAYASIEVFANALVLAATVLTVGGVLAAASVASLGVLPLVLVGVGVMVGLGVKIVQALDERHHHTLTNGITRLFSKGWDLMRHAFSRKVSVPQQGVTRESAENALRASTLAAKGGSTRYCLSAWGEVNHLSGPEKTQPEEVTEHEPTVMVTPSADMTIEDELKPDEPTSSLPPPSSGACC